MVWRGQLVSHPTPGRASWPGGTAEGDFSPRLAGFQIRILKCGRYIDSDRAVMCQPHTKVETTDRKYSHTEHERTPPSQALTGANRYQYAIFLHGNEFHCRTTWHAHVRSGIIPRSSLSSTKPAAGARLLIAQESVSIRDSPAVSSSRFHSTLHPRVARHAFPIIHFFGRRARRCRDGLGSRGTTPQL